MLLLSSFQIEGKMSNTIKTYRILQITEPHECLRTFMSHSLLPGTHETLSAALISVVDFVLVMISITT